MTEQEKDAFIVQLDVSTEELLAMRKPSPTAESLSEIIGEYKAAVAQHPKFCDSILSDTREVSWQYYEKIFKQKNAEPPYSADNILMEDIAEAFSAYERGDKDHALQVFAQCGAVVLRIMDELKKQIEK